MIVSYRGREIVFLDIEASSLREGSFPIEFGWVHDTAAPPEAFLVRPCADWRLNGDWSVLSQAVHGIERAQLDSDGIDVDEACLRLNRAFAGKTVAISSPGHDNYWIWRLYEGSPHKLAWQTEDCQGLLFDLAHEVGSGLDGMNQAITIATAAWPHPHRAGPDAFRMAMMARLILDPDLQADLPKMG